MNVEPASGDITVLLRKWKGGDASAFDELVPLVYPHLRLVAGAYLHREQNPDVLQATVLVHELYLRLLKQKNADWNDRQHFYTFCARMMRMILIDNARECQAKMRGSYGVPLNDDLSWVGIDSPELLDLDRALDELSSIDSEMVKLIELRYFLGCTTEETAELMQLSKATINRQLKFIKSWLYIRICPGSDPAPSSA
ncbi:MAG TPA: ECF-type sigma factor [Terracidiphilus sp.]|jgi:RNA polymerase sigma factor (TIGR02999 family)